jgi:hypothetical protein
MTPAQGARVQPGFASAGRGGSIARRDCGVLNLNAPVSG